MGFMLKVRFSGLCHYIANEKADEFAVKVCVVLPLAPEHEAQIVVHRGSATDSKTGQAVSKLGIAGKRISWRYTLASAGADPLRWEKVVTINSHDVHGAIPMIDVAPSFADVNPGIVAANKGSNVGSQVLLDRGYLRPSAMGPKSKWVLSWLQNKPEKVIWVSSAMDLRVEGLKAVALVVTDFAGKKAQKIELKPDNDGIVGLLLSNDCPKKKQTPIPQGKEDLKGKVDNDFIYHYDLLSPSVLAGIKSHNVIPPLPTLDHIEDEKQIMESLKTLEKPSKNLELSLAGWELKVAGISSGAGCNCLGAEGKSRPIENLDPFLKI